jgi:hypothetical protein
VSYDSAAPIPLANPASPDVGVLGSGALPLLGSEREFEGKLRVLKHSEETAPQVYCWSTQANTIDCLNYLIKSFAFHIGRVRTDDGDEFQAKVHWHVEDHCIHPGDIKSRSPTGTASTISQHLMAPAIEGQLTRDTERSSEQTKECLFRSSSSREAPFLFRMSENGLHCAPGEGASNQD